MAQVKVKTIKTYDDDGTISSSFNQILGTENAEVEIIRPKYIKLRDRLVRVAKLLDALTIDRIADVIPEQKDCLIEINKFANELIEVSKVKTISDEEVPFDKEEMNALYKSLKDNVKLRVMFLILKDLRPYHTHLTEESDRWIVDMPGISFKVFSNFSEFNLKVIWLVETPAPAKEYINTIICRIYKLSDEIAEIATSPDIDPEKFSEFIQTQVESLRKNIPRCDEAFDRIAASSSMLKENFGEYYRGFVQSGDPTSMIQSFVMDVSKKEKISPKITRQYKEIIKFYNKNTAGREMPEKYKKLMNKLNETYALVERKHEEAEKKTAVTGVPVDLTENKEEPEPDKTPKTETQLAKIKRKKARAREKKKREKETGDKREKETDD